MEQNSIDRVLVCHLRNLGSYLRCTTNSLVLKGVKDYSFPTKLRYLVTFSDLYIATRGKQSWENNDFLSQWVETLKNAMYWNSMVMETILLQKVEVVCKEKFPISSCPNLIICLFLCEFMKRRLLRKKNIGSVAVHHENA